MAKALKNDIQARREILQSALFLFAEKGFDAVSVREIAKRSKQNLAMISYYFGGKEGLYKAILSEYLEETTLQVKKILDRQSTAEMTPKSFQANIRAVISLVFEMKTNNPEIINLLQREKVNGMPFARELHELYIKPLSAEILSQFNEAKKKKIIKSSFLPGVFMGLITEAIHGYMIAVDCDVLPIKGEIKLPRDKEKFIDFVTELFLEGMMRS